MQWIVLLVAVAVVLGLGSRVLGGSTRMTLVGVVAVALVGLMATLK